MLWYFLVILSALVAPAKTISLEEKEEEEECSCRLPSNFDFDIKPFKNDFDCYFTLRKKGEFFTAREMCYQSYGQLATFSSVQEVKSVLSQIQCPAQCPDICDGSPCVPCNVTVCPIQAEISFWLNIYGGKYLQQDLHEVNIPSEIVKTYLPDPHRGHSVIYSHDFMFFDYSPDYIAKPFCKIDCLLRQNANDLTKPEIENLQHGLLHLSSDWSHDNLNSYLMTYKLNLRNKLFKYDHNSNVFFHWVRLFVLNFELLLLRKLEKPIGLPYWDWTSLQLPQLVVSKTFIDIDSLKSHNLFRGITGPLRFEKKLVFRNPGIERSLQKNKCSMWLDLKLALSLVDFCDFLQQYSTVVSRILMLIGHDKEFSIANPQYAVYDPLFALIMVNVDRHFALWRRIRIQEGRDPNIKKCGHSNIIEKPLEPFHSALMWNKFIKAHSLPKLLDSHAHLFYRYDTRNVSIYAENFIPECDVSPQHSHLWLKIELFEEVLCSVNMVITVSLPRASHWEKPYIIYRDDVYILNHLCMRDRRKIQFYKDVSKVLEKYPHFQDQCRVDLKFQYSNRCTRKRYNMHFETFFVEGHEPRKHLP